MTKKGERYNPDAYAQQTGTAQLGYAPNPVERTDVGSAGETLKQTTGDGDAGKVMTSLDNTVRQNAQKMNTVNDLIRMNSELDSKNRQADADYQRRLAGWTKYRGAVDLGNAVADLFTATRGAKTAKYRKPTGHDGVVENEFARILRQQRADNQQLYTNALNALKYGDAEEKNYRYNQYRMALANAAQQRANDNTNLTNARIITEGTKQDSNEALASQRNVRSQNDTKKTNASIGRMAVQNTNDTARVGIAQQNADTNAAKAGMSQTQSKTYTDADGNVLGTVTTTTNKTSNGNNGKVQQRPGVNNKKNVIKRPGVK